MAARRYGNHCAPPTPQKSPKFEPASANSSVSRAGFVSDSVAGQTDQLEIDEEVRTFAAVIVARDVDPPLAIGLFDDWGSGRSFFMNALHGFVEKLAARSKQSGGLPVL